MRDLIWLMGHMIGAAPPPFNAPIGKSVSVALRLRLAARHNPRMPTRSLFPTLVYAAALQRRGARAFNDQLRREITQLRHDDEAGRRWSARHYRDGYSSYNSASRMHRVSPSFAALEHKLVPHVRAFCRALGLQLGRHRLEMTDCWANVMWRGASHGLHLHPASTISGTYYVQAPRHAPGLKFEDPRLDRMMAAPPRRRRASSALWIELPARDGQLLLFESWLRHEVPRQTAAPARISVSFNYSWF
jgi:uncharacterized protein (TIGR02466 family)